jgi:clan AA aspartic protease
MQYTLEYMTDGPFYNGVLRELPDIQARARSPEELEKNILREYEKARDGNLAQISLKAEPMGRVVETIKLTNVFDPSRSVEMQALVDTGATMLVVPIDIAEQMGLQKVRDVEVQYANGEIASKTIFGIVRVDLKGRFGNFDVLAESAGSQALIGQIVLEELDLVVDLKKRALAPNPKSPDVPLLEII